MNVSSVQAATGELPPKVYSDRKLQHDGARGALASD